MHAKDGGAEDGEGEMGDVLVRPSPPPPPLPSKGKVHGNAAFSVQLVVSKPSLIHRR